MSKKQWKSYYAKTNRTSLSFFMIIDTEDMNFESFNNDPAPGGNTQPQNAGRGMGGDYF